MGLLQHQGWALSEGKEIHAAPAGRVESLLHPLGDKLGLLRVPGPVCGSSGHEMVPWDG